MMLPHSLNGTGPRPDQAVRPPAAHPLPVRLFHWSNAVATIVMIGSGLQIYAASPVIPFLRFPAWLGIGGWLGGALLWHFAAMWLLAGNLALWIAFGFLSGRFQRRLWPVSIAAALREARLAFAGQLPHSDLFRYNAVQRLLYAGAFGLLLLAVVSGLSIWKPVQLQWLTNLFGGFQGARVGHFLVMAALSAFLGLHVVMALLVPRTLKAMILGGRPCRRLASVEEACR